MCVCVFIHTYLHDVCLQYVNGLYICGLLTVAIIFTWGLKHTHISIYHLFVGDSSICIYSNTDIYLCTRCLSSNNQRILLKWLEKNSGLDRGLQKKYLGNLQETHILVTRAPSHKWKCSKQFFYNCSKMFCLT